MTKQAEQAFAAYDWMLSEEESDKNDGSHQPSLTRELARIVLPVSTYTQWYWKIDLHNLLHFLELRADPHAQLEIRVYAEAILAIVKQWVPLTYQAFERHRLTGARLSGSAVEYLARLLKGEIIADGDSGLSKRELREVRSKFGLD